MPRVLIQMGHVAPREPGFETGTGAAGEIALVGKIGHRLHDNLTDDGRIEATLVPGDIPDGWRGHVVIALHADAASSADAGGYSFGWPPAELGPKTRKLLALLAREYEKLPGHPGHRNDNYTAAMRSYYGWKRTAADAKVLIEHGFLTNPTERAWMTAHADEIADAWTTALLDYFDLTEPPTLTWTVDGFAAGERIAHKRTTHPLDTAAQLRGTCDRIVLQHK